MPFKKKTGKPIEELKPIKRIVEEEVLNESREGYCACGEPVAPGQSQVCKNHIRSR